MKNLLSIAVLSLLIMGCKEKVKETEEAAIEAVANTEMEVAENEWQPLRAKKMGKADFRPAIADHYLTNPIARASQLMAELSANAASRDAAPMAAE